MKEELLDKIILLHEAMQKLDHTWNKIDWSKVPESVSENYPFHQDLNTMNKELEKWIEVIRRS